MTAKRLGVRAAFVDGWVVAGDVEIAAGRIVSLGATPPGRADLAIPGYLDLQVNGFGGADFLSADPADYEVAAPEQPGGFELLDWLTRRGIVVAIGHTVADAAVAQAAFNHGARAVTHLHTMDRAVRNLVDLGVPWPAAVAAATSTPARLVGQEDLATLRPRTTADIAVLDDRLNVVRTLRAGREIWAAG